MSLVQLNILPEECAPRKGRSAIAPGLVERRRSVIRERLKDGLRVWVEKRAVLMQRRRKAEVDSEIVGVRGLVRRFSSATQDERGIADCAVTMEKKKAHAKWGRELERAKTREKMRSLGATEDGCCSQPTRAHVLGLRRFWEGVIKAAGG